LELEVLEALLLHIPFDFVSFQLSEHLAKLSSVTVGPQAAASDFDLHPQIFKNVSSLVTGSVISVNVNFNPSIIE